MNQMNQDILVHDTKDEQHVENVEEIKSSEVLTKRINCFKSIVNHCNRGTLAYAVTNIFLMMLILGFCWGVTGDMALPGGKLFVIILVYATSYLFGILATKMYLPDLFGMIVAGIILRNIPLFNFEETLVSEWPSFLRGTALATILIRAGMGLDAQDLKQLSCSVLRLAALPCVIEICCSAVVSHFLLGLPWNYGFILGSVLAAVSPAVVVPCLLSLSDRGYGVDKGIPTLVIAASSVDDILAISIFGVLIGITFAEGSITFIALKAPLEIVMGAGYGLILGCIMWFIPHNLHHRKMLIRFILLLLAALVGLFASQRIGFGGAGPFAALLLGFVVQLRWRKEKCATEHEKGQVSAYFEMVWTIFKPFLFGLIGAEVAFSKIELKVIGVGMATLLIGLSFRMITTFLVVSGNNFNIKEKLFITMAWFPKATVQAAIGGVTLDMVRKNNGTTEELGYSLQIISIAVLSIIITAPIGAIMISNLGPKLLRRSPDMKVNEKDQVPPESSQFPSVTDP